MLLLKEGYASVAIEAKAGEEFDKTISEWMTKKSEGKTERLQFLTQTLGLSEVPPGNIRYQLVHRAASAVLEAIRWKAPVALMLIQCFKESPSSWSDYCAFAGLLGINAGKRDLISGPRRIAGVDLFLGWIGSPMADDATAAKAI